MLKAYLNLTLAMIIVGSSVVAGKIMVNELPVFLSSGLRFLLATAVMLPILYFREGGLPRLSRKSWLILTFQALCGSFLFTVFLLYGLKQTSPASAGIITSTTPMFMGIIGWLFFKEKCSAGTIFGISLSLAGVVILGSAEQGVQAKNSITGFMLILGAVMAESVFLVLRKWVAEPLSPMAATTIICLLGLLWFLPCSAYEITQVDLSAVSMRIWQAVTYYGLVVTVLAYLFWFAGIMHVPASTAGSFTGIMPVSAICLSTLILNEQLQWFHFAGCCFVLAGIITLSVFRPLRSKENQLSKNKSFKN